ncbi:NADPH-dependent F420 reductase [Alloscardovia venturai]|uniref:NADPH-dependent F420 reductase n=1 Tax=Alloscardovia venturai TaxID=1769421 RepID=A0ABW2Y4K6_9BIFI
MTNVTIIGAGNIGSAVAGIALKSGAHVQVLDRSTEKAQAISDYVHAGTLGDEITGDIVILALPYEAIESVIAEHGAQFAGKIVVDVTNPLDFQTGDIIADVATTSAAEKFATALPQSTVIKAFNTNFAATLGMGNVHGQTTTVMMASDSSEAKETFASIIKGAGLKVIDAGALKRAHEMEAFGALQINLAMTNQIPWTGGFAVVTE